MINFKKSNISITANCSFGLGNRLYTLIGAMYIAKKINISQINVIWRPDDECNCTFFDLFQPVKNIVFINEIDNQYTNINITCGFNLNNKQENFYFDPLDSFFISSLKNKIFKKISHKHQEVNIVYTSVAIPQEIKLEFILSVLYKLKINKKILNRAYKFIIKNSIDNKTRGFHFRKTDKTAFFNQYTLDQYNQHLNYIHSNQKERIFVASDDKKTLDILSIYKNVITMQNIHYPLYFLNTKQIIRNKQSVFDSLCTMLVLSRTTLLNFEMIGSSSFLGCTYYLSFIDTKTLFNK